MRKLDIKANSNNARRGKRGRQIFIGVSILLALLFLSFFWYGLYTFIKTYTFRTPIIIQNPIVKREVKKTVKNKKERTQTHRPLVKQVEASQNEASEATATSREYTESDALTAIKKHFGDEWKMAVAIATPESGMDCSKRSYQMNTNGTYDHGLFQINEIHLYKLQDGESIYDCDVNARIAKEIKDSWQGWHAWSVFQNGSYKQYL